jgi:hypothetical protein
VHTEFWWGKLKEGDHLEDLGPDEKIILKWISRGDVGARTGLITLRIGPGGGHFYAITNLRFP